MPKKIEMLGKKFGRLTVIAEAPRSKSRKAMWICKCDCGIVTAPIPGDNLRNGHTKSCGCFRSSVAGANRSKKHGMRNTKIYSVWLNVKNRCFNPNNKDFKSYGGRGITVYEEWKNDFQEFYDYVSKLSHFGEEGYSLDRINNDGNYEPGNVRWATAKEQANNRRNNANRQAETA